MRSRSSETEDGAAGAQTSTSGADSCIDGTPTTNTCSVSDVISLMGEYSAASVHIRFFTYVTNGRARARMKQKGVVVKAVIRHESGAAE